MEPNKRENEKGLEEKRRNVVNVTMMGLCVLLVVNVIALPRIFLAATEGVEQEVVTVEAKEWAEGVENSDATQSEGTRAPDVISEGKAIEIALQTMEKLEIRNEEGEGPFDFKTLPVEAFLMEGIAPAYESRYNVRFSYGSPKEDADDGEGGESSYEVEVNAVTGEVGQIMNAKIMVQDNSMAMRYMEVGEAGIRDFQGNVNLRMGGELESPVRINQLSELEFRYMSLLSGFVPRKQNHVRVWHSEDIEEDEWVYEYFVEGANQGAMTKKADDLAVAGEDLKDEQSFDVISEEEAVEAAIQALQQLNVKDETGKEPFDFRTLPIDIFFIEGDAPVYVPQYNVRFAYTYELEEVVGAESEVEDPKFMYEVEVNGVTGEVGQQFRAEVGPLEGKGMGASRGFGASEEDYPATWDAKEFAKWNENPDNKKKYVRIDDLRSVEFQYTHRLGR